MAIKLELRKGDHRERWIADPTTKTVVIELNVGQRDLQRYQRDDVDRGADPWQSPQTTTFQQTTANNSKQRLQTGTLDKLEHGDAPPPQ